MKKLLIIFLAFFVFAPIATAGERYAAILDRVGFDGKFSNVSAQTEIKNTFAKHLKYANAYDLNSLEKLYLPNYLNGDGFARDVYFSLVKKTWENYPTIRYTLEIKNIDVTGETAIVETREKAIALTGQASDVVAGKGILESVSDGIYYLEKVANDWKILSDLTISEQTSLKYGDAKLTDMYITAPAQVGAGTDYTATLSIVPPKDTMVIASIGREKITHPQEIAEEVFRKLPSDGLLERMFAANTDNINEYIVASVGLTKAEIKDTTSLKIYITGIGFVMSRVNVIPKNNFIKETDEKTLEQKK